jgi:hypothetical protein
VQRALSPSPQTSPRSGAALPVPPELKLKLNLPRMSKRGGVVVLQEASGGPAVWEPPAHRASARAPAGLAARLLGLSPTSADRAPPPPPSASTLPLSPLPLSPLPLSTLPVSPVSPPPRSPRSPDRSSGGGTPRCAAFPVWNLESWVCVDRGLL